MRSDLQAILGEALRLRREVDEQRAQARVCQCEGDEGAAQAAQARADLAQAQLDAMAREGLASLALMAVSKLGQ